MVIVMKNKKIIIGIIIIIALIIGGTIFIINKKDTNLITLNKNELKEKIDNKDSFILVVSQAGCSHCAEYIPVLKEILKDNDIKAYIIDLKAFSKSDRQYLTTIANTSGTPTTLFIEKGEEKATYNRIVGSSNRKNIEAMFKKNGYIK